MKVGGGWKKKSLVWMKVDIRENGDGTGEMTQ